MNRPASKPISAFSKGGLAHKAKRLLQGLPFLGSSRVFPRFQAKEEHFSASPKGEAPQRPTEATVSEPARETTLPLWPDPWGPLPQQAPYTERRTEARLLLRTARALERQHQFILAAAVYRQAETLLQEVEDAEDLLLEISRALQRVQKRAQPKSLLWHKLFPFPVWPPWWLGAGLLLASLVWLWWQVFP